MFYLLPACQVHPCLLASSWPDPLWGRSFPSSVSGELHLILPEAGHDKADVTAMDTD